MKTADRFRLLLSFLIGTMISTVSFAADVESLRCLVEDAERYARGRHTRRANQMFEVMSDYSGRPEFQALQRELAKSWRFALAHLDELAPDDLTKTLVLASCWSMDEDDFGDYLLEMVSLVEEGKLNPDIFRWCQRPYFGPLKGVLQKKRSNPSLREALGRARTIFSDDAILQQFYGSLLDGNTEHTRLTFKSEATFPPENLPQHKTTSIPASVRPDFFSERTRHATHWFLFAIGSTLALGLTAVCLWRCKAKQTRNKFSRNSSD